MGKSNSELKKLKIPYYPPKDNMEINYIVESISEKNVADYLKISVLDVEKLDYITYLFFLREAFIFNCSQTDEGKEYLKNAYRLEQTSPDREKLRKKIKEQNSQS